MLVLLTSVLGMALVLWGWARILRPFLAVRSRGDLARAFNANSASLREGQAISEIGAGTAAARRFEATRHRATIGLRLLATVLAPALFLVGNSMLVDPQLTTVPDDYAPWLAGGLLGFVVWYLLYIWTYSVEITRDLLIVPSPFLVRRRFQLDQVESVTDTGGYFVKVRFRGGRRVEVLKYVTGRDEMLKRLAQLSEATTGDRCQSFPKSKPSAAGSFR